MPHAALDPSSLPPAGLTTQALTPPAVTAPTQLCGSERNDFATLQDACAEIVARWRRAGLSEQAACEQAKRFAARFGRDGAERRYNLELAAVAEAMR